MSFPRNFANFPKRSSDTLAGATNSQQHFCPILLVASVARNKPGFESARCFSSPRPRREFGGAQRFGPPILGCRDKC